MSSTRQADGSEAVRVRQVAATYAAAGYQVRFEPAAGELPAFLAGYQPDFVAERDGEHVLVEVKHCAGGADDDRYRELAERVQGHPAWRVDLVSLGGPERLVLGSEWPVLPAPDVERRYQEASRLLADGHGEAAVLIGWAATEAALRLLAERNAVPVQRAATPVLLKQLVSLGVIAREQYDTLWSLYQQRNAIAHGFATQQTPSAERVIRVGRELLAEGRRAA